jgi:hypothetical protein
VLILAATGAANGDSAWRPIECWPADASPQARYEPLRMLDDFEAPELKWQPLVGDQLAKAALSRDASERHEGLASLQVNYDFIGKPDFEYVQIQGQCEFAAPGLGIGFWLKHDGTAFPLRMRVVDASGESHQFELEGSTAAGWQYVAGRLDGPSSHWGGDNNGRLDYPCQLSGLLFDRPEKGFVGTGRMWIDDVALVKPRKPESQPLKIEVQNHRFGNLYAVGDKVSLRASGPGERIRWVATSFFGRELARGEGPSPTTAGFTLDEPGWYSCTWELFADGRVVAAQTFACAALVDGTTAARSDFVGVCTHYGQNRYPLETMDLMLRYGIDQYRDEISWRGYEAQPGQYALPDYAAAFLQRSSQLKLRPLLIFDYSHPHYDDGGYPNSPAAITGFANYAADLARRTRGTVPMFEVWNEWTGGCGMDGRPGKHDAEAYGQLLKPTYAAVKAARADATVVGIGGEYGARCADDIVTAVRTAGPDSLDAWSIHPYRYPRSPESSDLAGEVTRIAARVAAAGVKSKAWITEIGYPTHRTSGGSSLAAQARHCVRTFVLLQATGEVEKVFWYDLKDDGLQRDYNEHNFGLLQHEHYNCAPKPALVALSTFIRLTGGAEFQALKQSGDSYAALYRRADGSAAIVAWTSRRTAPLRCQGKLTQVCDMLGGSHELAAEFELSENPVYLVGDALSLEDCQF